MAGARLIGPDAAAQGERRGRRFGKQRGISGSRDCLWGGGPPGLRRPSAAARAGLVVVLALAVLHHVAEPGAVGGLAPVPLPEIGGARRAGADRVVVGVVLAVALHAVLDD